MKKILIIIFAIVGVVAIVGGILLFAPSPPTTQKISNENILFDYSTTQTFHSNKKANGNFESYTLTISNNAGVNFENAEITSSTNVEKTCQDKGFEIVVNFKIKFGNNFSFTLKTDNFETITNTKPATEYIQKENIKLLISTTQNGEYVEADDNTIYLVDVQYKAQAAQDGFVSEYYIKADYISTISTPFEISVADSGLLNYDSSTNLLTAKKVSSTQQFSHVTISATDGSGATKNFDFKTSYVEATGVSNLPNKIDLDVDTNKSTTLEPLAIPVYAKGYEITFETSDNKIFEVDQFTIKAVAKGQANLSVKLNGVEVKIISVDVTAVDKPEFVISLQEYVVELYGDKVNFEDDTCTLNVKDLSGAPQLTFDVGFENLGVTPPAVGYQILSDGNSIIVQNTPEDGLNIGVNPITFTIFVDATKTGTASIKLTGTANNMTFEKTLTIILINT